MEIGTELIFKNTSFSTSLKKWERILLAVNEAIQFFNELGMGDVDSIIWDKMCRNKIEEIREAYHKFISLELKRSKQTLSVILKNSFQAADEQLNILQDKINKFRNVRDIEDTQMSGDMQLDFGYISIVNGRAILTEESIKKIRKAFCITIENENQARFYDLAEQVKNAYTAFRTFYKEHSFRAVEDHVQIIDSQALLYEQQGKLHFVEEFIPDIK